MSIQISHVTKHFGNFRALNDVSLDIASGELLALLGPFRDAHQQLRQRGLPLA